MTIQVLKKQGQSIKAISRKLSISRNTVKKYLSSEDTTPQYQLTNGRPSKLDPYKDYIHQRIQSAAPDWIPAAVLYQEIVSLGYPGKVRIVSDYIAQFKPTPTSDPLQRFETKPGVSYSQIWCMGIKQLSCLIAPLLVRRLGISRC